MVAMVALVLLLAAVPAASAKIVPQKSIAGVKLGMTESQVVARLGTPEQRTTQRHEIAGDYTSMIFGLTIVDLFPNGGVFRVSTTSRNERTSTGARVGSTERGLRKAVKGLRCATEFGRRSCILGRQEAGRTVTTFWISRKSKRVQEVTLRTVID
jgi:hypothetical protein